MGKAKKASRKELEDVVGKIIQEIQYLGQAVGALDSCLGAYIKYKGDTLTFNDYFKSEIDKAQKKAKADTQKPRNPKDVDSAKRERYRKITSPL
tara:strand:+ start:36 stop:317 length:282 start_codon:yes stop_codon:yes gene_type:complete